jgi:hypothetical protein
VFERHREKRAAREYQQQLTGWQQQRDGCAEALEIARTCAGEPAAGTYAGDPASEIMLKPGESVFAGMAGASLIEERRGRGQWEGRSSGVSVPVGSLGGRSVRYRVGGTRGHYVQGAPAPTAIDTGTLYVTNMRVIFQGTRQTRECLFSKLVGFQHDDQAGTTVFSVSNRQKPMTVFYGPEMSAWFDFRLGLALAHYRNDLAAFIAHLQADLASLDAHKPQPPAAAAS